MGKDAYRPRRALKDFGKYDDSLSQTGAVRCPRSIVDKEMLRNGPI